MISQRHIKQMYYGGGCLIFVAVFFMLAVFLIVRPSFEPGPPTPSPTPQYEDIVVEQVNSVRHGDLIDVVARIRNPNPRAGTGRYVVTFVLVDSDGNEAI